MQLVLAMAMTAASMARAQQAEVQPAGGGDPAVAAQFVQVAQAMGNSSKDSLFDDTSKFAKGATDVSEINLDPKTMGLVPGSYAGNLAHRMKFMVIHDYTYDKPGMYSMEDVEAYRRKLNDGTWNCSIHVRNKEGATDICSRVGPNNDGSEMVIISAEPKELSFIHMSGNVSLADMARTGSTAAYLNQDLYSGSGATAKAAAAKATDAAAKATDAAAKASDAQAKARDAQAKATVIMKRRRTFRLGSMSYSSESSTPAKKSGASASSTGSPTADSSTMATPDSSAPSGSNSTAPPATPPAPSAPAK
jgi:hypothetical protein